MRPPCLPLLGLITLSALSPVLAAEPLAAVLPAESVMFLNVTNLTRLRTTAESHPLIKPLTQGEVGKALKPFLEKLQGEADAKTATVLKEETGLTLTEILAKFPGAAAASLSMNFQKLVVEGADDPPDLGFAVVLDYTGDEALMVKLLGALDKFDRAKSKADKEDSADDEDEEGEEDSKPVAVWPEDYEENVADVNGAKVHEWTVADPEKKRGETLAWAVIGGKAAFAVGKTDLKEIVGRLTKPSTEGSLASTEAWKSIPAADLEESDVLGGFNLHTALGAVQEGLRVKMEKGEMNTGGLPVNPLQAWTGAGLDQFRAAFFATDFEEDAAAVHWSVTYAEKPALLKIYAAKGPGTPPDFIPADVHEVAWGTFDWGQAFDAVKEVATAISPMAAGGIEMGLAEGKKATGVDIRRELIGQMGDNLWTTSYIDPEAVTSSAKGKTGGEKDEEDDGPAGTGALSALAISEGQSQVIGISLRDAKAFELALKTLINNVAPDKGLFESREFLGHTIQEVKGVPPPTRISWLIADETLIFGLGQAGLLEKVLTGMNKKPSNPLVEEPHVKAALAKLPESGAVSTGYSNAGQMIDVVFAALKPMLEENAEGEAGEIIKNLPDKLNLPWQTVSRLYLGSQSADLRLRLSLKP